MVCATCVGAGGDQLQFMHFGLVVLDEGSQCRCGIGRCERRKVVEGSGGSQVGRTVMACNAGKVDQAETLVRVLTNCSSSTLDWW